MNTMDAILKRRSTRKFTNQKIEEKEIKKLLEAAMAAPSACNKQPWLFYVIENEELLAKIKGLSNAYNYNSTLGIIVIADTRLGIYNVANDFYNQDCSAAIENILLEATELGIGTVWCGISPNKEREAGFIELLNLEEYLVPIGYIQLGYPAEDKEARTQYNENLVKYYK